MLFDNSFSLLLGEFSNLMSARTFSGRESGVGGLEVTRRKTAVWTLVTSRSCAKNRTISVVERVCGVGG